MTIIRDLIYPFLFEFLKVNFTAASEAQVSQNVLLFFEQVEIWLLVLRPWKFVDQIAKKHAQSLMPEISTEKNYLLKNIPSISFNTLFQTKPGTTHQPILTSETKSENPDIYDKQILHDYGTNVIKPYVYSSIVFYAPLLEIYLKRYSTIMLNNFDDENKKLYKVCEAFLDLKEHVKSADELITKFNALPSYDRPTQGEGAIICKSLGLLGSSYRTLENISREISQVNLARNVIQCVQKKSKSSNSSVEPLLKILSNLFDLPVEAYPSTSPDKMQASNSQQLHRNDYEDVHGKLTSYGKEMLKRGQYHCSKNVKFMGDSRFQPTRSYEIDFLVKLTSEVSRRLEIGYGTVYDLRVLARRSSVIFMSIALSIFLEYFFFGRLLSFLIPISLFLYFLVRS